MPTRPVLFLTLPEIDPARPDEVAAHFAPLQIMLEGLCQVNEFLMRRARELAAEGRGKGPYPSLYTSGIYYQEEEPGHEDWLDCGALLATGFGDCEDVVAYRVGECRADGIPAEPVLKWQWVTTEDMIKHGYKPHQLPPDGVWLVHCLVRMPDGTVEDPSKRLGMGGEYLQAV